MMTLRSWETVRNCPTCNHFQKVELTMFRGRIVAAPDCVECGAQMEFVHAMSNSDPLIVMKRWLRKEVWGGMTRGDWAKGIAVGLAMAAAAYVFLVLMAGFNPVYDIGGGLG